MPSALSEHLGFQWNLKLVGPEDAPSLLWFHGFMGSLEDWETEFIPDFADHRNILVDLPGHGDSRMETPLTVDVLLRGLVHQLEMLGIQQVTVIGYSMGGRLALHLQHQYPQLVTALVCLSAAPGLRTEAERTRRKADDEALMERLEDVGFDNFLLYWYRLPLFCTLSAHSTAFSNIYLRRRSNDAIQLGYALRSLGNGMLPSLWDTLQGIHIPTLLMSGSEDSKYCDLREMMAAEILDCRQVTIPDTSHAFHLEKPIETAQAIRHFLSNLNEGVQGV